MSPHGAYPLGWMRCMDGDAHYLVDDGLAACGERTEATSRAVAGNSRHACPKCRAWALKTRPRGVDRCALCCSALFQRFADIAGLCAPRAYVRERAPDMLKAAECCGEVYEP